MDRQVRERDDDVVGQWIDGFPVRVINERAVRAGAGILFLGGVVLFAVALQAGSIAAMKPFGIAFMADMVIRLGVGDRWSPVLALARLIVRRQSPEWVGAKQKEYAWWFGVAMAVISCASMGLFAAPPVVTLLLCGTCLAFLYGEAAFGICVGCGLYRVVHGRDRLRYCPGDSCVRDGGEG